MVNNESRQRVVDSTSEGKSSTSTPPVDSTSEGKSSTRYLKEADKIIIVMRDTLFLSKDDTSVRSVR